MWLFWPLAVHALRQVPKCAVTPHIFYDQVIGGGKGGGMVFKAVGIDPFTCQDIPLAVKYNYVKSAKDRHSVKMNGKPWTLKKVNAMSEYNVLSALAGTPGIVRVLGLTGSATGVFEVDGEQLREPGIVMDYVSGQNLTHYLQTASPASLPSERVLSLFSRAVGELKNVWDRGFYQGDAHTGNFIVSGDDKLWLLDFGYSRRLSGPSHGLIEKARDLKSLCNHFQHHLLNRADVLVEPIDSSLFRNVLTITDADFEQVHQQLCKTVSAIRPANPPALSLCSDALKKALDEKGRCNYVIFAFSTFHNYFEY